MSSSSSSGGGAVEHIDQISSGWNYLGVVRIGDNAVSGSVWEFCVGADTQSNCTTGERVWDPDISDGIDSGWVDIALTVQLNGGAGSMGTLQVKNDAVDYSQGSYSHITKVQMQTRVDGLIGEVQFGSITAVFTRAGGSSESVPVDSNLNPDAHNSSGSGIVQQAIQINPSSSNFVKVEITAQVKMTSPQKTLPLPDALSAGIYVFTA